MIRPQLRSGSAEATQILFLKEKSLYVQKNILYLWSPDGDINLGGINMGRTKNEGKVYDLKKWSFKVVGSYLVVTSKLRERRGRPRKSGGD